MPSPVAHTLSGYIIYRFAFTSKAASWKKLLLCCVSSNLPDVDFLPGFLLGKPNYFHHGISHSIGFSVAFALLMGSVFYIKGGSFLRNFLLFFSLYFSHVLLDLLSYDSSIPYGLTVLWPFTGDYYISPLSLFLDIHRSSESATFITSMFNIHNLMAVLLELALFTPLIVVSVLLTRVRKKEG
jgi:inner membrane protein